MTNALLSFFAFAVFLVNLVMLIYNAGHGRIFGAVCSAIGCAAFTWMVRRDLKSVEQCSWRCMKPNNNIVYRCQLPAGHDGDHHFK
jgi:hypothetical protein